MNPKADLHNDKFFDNFIIFAIFNFIVGLITSIIGFLVVVATIYFFLAAAGIVPPQDIIPVIPFI